MYNEIIMALNVIISRNAHVKFPIAVNFTTCQTILYTHIWFFSLSPAFFPLLFQFFFFFINVSDDGGIPNCIANTPHVYARHVK